LNETACVARSWRWYRFPVYIKNDAELFFNVWRQLTKF
jgi:hypothetical protein